MTKFVKTLKKYTKQLIILSFSTILLSQQTVFLEKKDLNSVSYDTLNGSVTIEGDLVKIRLDKVFLVRPISSVVKIVDNELGVPIFQKDFSYDNYNYRINKKNKKVSVNKNTRNIHLQGVYHEPDGENKLEFSNVDEAIAVGYIKCNACFDTSLPIGDIVLEKIIAQELIKSVMINYEIQNEHKDFKKLDTIMKKVLKAWPEELLGYDYRVQIIRNTSPNAFAIPGGNIYFTTGLIEMLETEAEIESIMAHEIAHIEKRHSLRYFKSIQEKGEKLQALKVALVVLASASGRNNAFKVAEIIAGVAEYANTLILKGFSREYETESDVLASLYFKDNNLDNKPLVSALDRLATYSITRQGFVPEEGPFSDHPSLISRMIQAESGEFLAIEDKLEGKINLTKVMYYSRPEKRYKMDTNQGKTKKSINEKNSIIESFDNYDLSFSIDKIYKFRESNFTDVKYIFLAKITNDSEERALSSYESTFIVRTKNAKKSNKYKIGFSKADLFPKTTRNITGSILVKSQDIESFEKKIIDKQFESNLVFLPLTESELKQDNSKKKKRGFIDLRKFIGGAISFKK